MDRTRWIIFAVICAAIIGILAFTRDSGTSFDGDPAKVVEGDNIYGKKDSQVVFIEYGDFQCSSCGAFYPTLKEVKEQYKDQVTFVFRHLPLTTAHPHAKAAAAAAQAAAKQGKFWEMHDKLFETQSQWSSAQANNRSSFFEQYAEEIGLDMAAYRKDVASSDITDRVNRDVGAAKKAGFPLSTPTIVLNGKLIDNSQLRENNDFSANKLREVLNGVLQEKGITPPKLDEAKESE